MSIAADEHHIVHKIHTVDLLYSKATLIDRFYPLSHHASHRTGLDNQLSSPAQNEGRLVGLRLHHLNELGVIEAYQ